MNYKYDFTEIIIALIAAFIINILLFLGLSFIFSSYDKLNSKYKTMREPRDCIGLNETSRDVKFKVYIPAFYDAFGCSYEEHKKYLPCIAILKKQGGDCFYYMTLLTEDGPIESAGYVWFEKTQNIDNALHRKYFRTNIK